MGISRELDDLIRTVKFENLHMLTRAELYRFGIDTRPLAETAWKLEQEARPFLRKVAMLKKENGSSFRTMEWRLSCESGKRVPLTFAGEIDETSVGKSTILVTADADTDKAAGGSPLRAGKYEVWRGSIDPDMIKALLASRSLHVRETTPMPDDKADITKFDIGLTGLTSVWTQLVASCSSVASAPKSPWPAVSLPNVSTTPLVAPLPQKDSK
jgi:hypothetical protein